MAKQNEEYEVESVIGKRGLGEAMEYLIKWKGYPQDQSTWEPIRNLNKVQDYISRFNETKSTGKKTKVDYSTSEEVILDRKHMGLRGNRQIPKNCSRGSSDASSYHDGFIEEVKLNTLDISKKNCKNGKRTHTPKTSVRERAVPSKPPKKTLARPAVATRGPTSKLNESQVNSPSPNSPELQIAAANSIVDHFELSNEIYLKLDLPSNSKLKPTIVGYSLVELHRPALIATYFKKLIQTPSL